MSDQPRSPSQGRHDVPPPLDPQTLARLEDLERRRDGLNRRYTRLYENLVEQRDLLAGQEQQLALVGRELEHVDRALEEARERAGG